MSVFYRFIDSASSVCFVALLMGSSFSVHAQTTGVSNDRSPWSIEVLYRTSLPFLSTGLPDESEVDDRYQVDWLAPVVTGYGVRIRRQIGRSWQVAFGLLQTRRRYTADVSWSLDPLSATESPPNFSGQLEWVMPSYGIPIIFRTEVPLSENIDLGAGGGVHLEFFPSDVFTANYFSADSSQYTYDQYTRRAGWMRSAATVELGCVFGLSDGSGLHVGVQIQRALGQWFGAESYGRYDDEISHVQTYLSGHHWGLDVRWILP